MLSKILNIPFILLTLIFLYLAWEVHYDYAAYIIWPIVGIVLVYFSSPQIDWWWYQRNPPELKAPLRHLLNTQFPFYQNLDVIEKELFRNRVALYMEANEFMPQRMDVVPYDVRGVIAANAVWLTFRQEDFLLNKFEKIIVYPNLIPTPQFPEHWHACEIFEGDGVILFAIEQLMKSFLQPRKYYNIGLHEYAKIFKISYPDKDYPDLPEDIWGKLESISGFSQEDISTWIGLPDIDVYAVSVAHFFVFQQKFQQVLPEIYNAYQNIFSNSTQNFGLEHV